MTLKKPCPKCGSRDVTPIVFGLPGPELTREAEEGKVYLGGCCISDTDPDRHCNACDHEWATQRRVRSNG